MFSNLPLEGKKVVCVVSGGNIDVTFLNRIIDRGLLKSGRLCTMSIELLDSPGQLVMVASLIADMGANVTHIHHTRTRNSEDVKACTLQVSMETRDNDHINQIVEAFRAKGVKILAID